ncbi:MAG: FtsX-like permease family protein [Planctomycetota bacterium]|nr:FtsX-like permease family protein [Planctomycetota bacterium]
MKSSDLLRESLLNLRRRPLRVAFASGGVAVGALAVALLLSLGAGLHNFVEAQTMAFSDPVELDVYPEPKASVGDIVSFAMGQMGTPAKPMEEEQKEEQELMRSFGRVRPRFTAEQIQGISEIEHVAVVERQQRASIHSISVEGNKSRFRADLRPTYSGPQIALVAGKAIDPESQTQEAILAFQWVESFGLKRPEDLIGKTIQLTISSESRRRERFMPYEKDSKKFQDFPVVVVGVTGETIASRSVFISRRFAETLSKSKAQLRERLKKDRESERNEDEERDRRERRDEEKKKDAKKGPRSLIVRAKSKEMVPLVKTRLKDLGYGVISLEDKIGVIGRIFLVIDAVLASVGIVAFLVASLGIANTLIMAVHERTSEIGLWKAIGATNKSVGLMFAFEAAAMGTLGGLMGILGAAVLGLIGNEIAGRYFLQNVVGYQVFVFPAWLILSTVALSTIVSLLAGILPARRAARLAPVAALRRDG